MKFEQAFHIPADHTLKQVSFKQKGTMLQDELWEHEEFDQQGLLVARFTSWSCTSLKAPFATDSGWKKTAPDGEELQSSETLES